jgi:hypothetical protein
MCSTIAGEQTATPWSVQITISVFVSPLRMVESRSIRRTTLRVACRPGDRPDQLLVVPAEPDCGPVPARDFDQQGGTDFEPCRSDLDHERIRALPPSSATVWIFPPSMPVRSDAGG